MKLGIYPWDNSLFPEVGVMVEWLTAGGPVGFGPGKVGPRCNAIKGKVLKIAEARGKIPLHTRCRCTWIPANVGEKRKKPLGIDPLSQAVPGLPNLPGGTLLPVDPLVPPVPAEQPPGISLNPESELARLPRTKDEATTLASAWRDMTVGLDESACAVDGDCKGAASVIARVHPGIEIWHGNYDGEVGHYIAKAGDFYMDVTADQFKVLGLKSPYDLKVFTSDDIAYGAYQEYRGFRKVDPDILGRGIALGNKGFIETLK